jgi:predicted MPP superfamily phosphohydrolase
LKYAGFIAVILAITALCWLLVGALLHPLVPGGFPSVMTAWAISVVPLFVLVRNLATHRTPSAAVRLFLFRPFWYAQLLMLPLALIGGTVALAGLPFGAAGLVGQVAVLALASVLVIAGIAGYFGSRRLIVRTIVLWPRKLPAALDGLRVVQLSDLHVGPHTSARQLGRIATAVRAAKPDLIAYTGDQVDDYPGDMDDFAAAFGTLVAPLGAFAVPGNHDVYAGWTEVRRRTERIGIRVLVNEAMRIDYRGASFWIAGTGDPAGHQVGRDPGSGAPDTDRTMGDVPPDAFSLVLAHNPALFPFLADRGASVVLSGHTHHGQLSIPSKKWSLASVFLEFAMGQYERGGSLLYVSPGTNYWGIPFRLGAWPEVTIVELRADAAHHVPTSAHD